ncbi:MAG: PIN domain-containing protein [Spirochaetia bacterium]|jgi:predicted nucleic acid-binding protein|nr:PIN domain-containing protein [Spirochaetia bacterium]
MVKIFIDSDVILDLLIKRNDFESSALLLTKIINKEIEGFSSPLVFANVYYINTKYEGKSKSIENLRKLRQLMSILTIDQNIIDEALFANAKDFEDSVQYTAAEKNHIDFIITRNKQDYKDSKLPILTAAEFLKIDIRK